MGRECPQCEIDLDPVEIRTGQFESDLRIAPTERTRTDKILRSDQRAANGYLCPECGQVTFFVES